jgi:uncharacterized protein (DUF2141 family)
MTLNAKSVIIAPKVLLTLLALSLLWSCASIQRPQGGPRDLSPPKLLNAEPKNLTRNFSANKIDLEFDEYFKLNNQYQEITIIPESDKAPEFKIRKKTLSIEFKDSLQANTTYVINFGKAIADVNENNILNNFTYVFSTGNEIDSLSISGEVHNNLTQKPEKDALVFILPVSQDSLFGKKKASIYTTSDSAGNFKLNNLKEGKYNIYALKEESPNKIFDNEKELIAFIKDTIDLTYDVTGIKLDLFKEDPEKIRVNDRKLDTDGKLLYTFNKGLDSPAVKIIEPAELDDQKIVDFSKKADTALIYLKNMSFDSIKVVIYSNNIAVDTSTFRKGKNETFKRNLSLRYNLNSDQQLNPKSNFEITANYPVENSNLAKISITEDSVQLKGFQLEKNLNDPKKFILKYPWKLEKAYRITFDEGTFTNIYGDINKKILTAFTVNNPENYGTMILNINLPADSSKSYIVELLNERKEVLSSTKITKDMKLNYPDYAVGKYSVRVIYDANNNGQWDSGSVKNRRQPEYIWNYEKEIILRANWEAEEKIDIPNQPPML